MAERSPVAADAHARDPWLWLAAGAGIALWGVHLLTMVGLTGYVCRTGQVVWLHLITVLTAVPTGLAILPCLRAWRGGTTSGGLAFVGGLGVLVNGISLLAIVAEWVPVLLIDACAR